MKTYSRAAWVAAQQAWDDGEFGSRWQTFRRLAAERGFIYPPTGTPHDDRDDDNPSQRAVIWRAIEDNPTQLQRIIQHSRSWHEVVDGIIGVEDRLRRDADENDAVARWQRANDPDAVGHDESVQTLAGILARIDDAR